MYTILVIVYFTEWFGWKHFLFCHPELDSGSIQNGALQPTLIDSESSSE